MGRAGTARGRQRPGPRWPAGTCHGGRSSAEHRDAARIVCGSDAAVRLQLVGQYIETRDAEFGAVANLEFDSGHGAEEFDRPEARLEHAPARRRRLACGEQADGAWASCPADWADRDPGVPA